MNARYPSQPMELSSLKISTSTGKTVDPTEGELFFIQLPLGKEHLLLIESSTNEFPRTSHRVKAQAGVFTFVELWVLPFESFVSFDVSTGGTITTWDGAEVVFPADSINTTGTVTAQLAWLNAADPNHLAAFPGGFRTTEGELLESFSAIAIEVRDADGKLLNLKEGAKALATIPVTSKAALSDDIPLWVYDEEAGLWKEEGMLTGCSSGFCSAELPHLSWWNADVPMEVTCLMACVVDSNNNPVAGVYLKAGGIDYFNFYGGFSGTDGCACLPVRTNSKVEVSGTLYGGILESVIVNTKNDPLVCGNPEDTKQCTWVSLKATPPKFQAVLHSELLNADYDRYYVDLDAHLTGPCPYPVCNEGRFHVYYGNYGSLSAPPFAALNGDYCGYHSSYQQEIHSPPEIITLSACSEGTYRYSVVDASPDYGMPERKAFADMKATVTLLLPGGEPLTRSLKESDNPQNHAHWIVGELQCKASCECTWVDKNTFEPYETKEKEEKMMCRGIAVQ